MRCRHWPATQTLRSLKMFITTQESARWSWSNASVRYMCYFNQVDQGHGSEAQLLVRQGTGRWNGAYAQPFHTPPGPEATKYISRAGSHAAAALLCSLWFLRLLAAAAAELPRKVAPLLWKDHQEFRQPATTVLGERPTNAGSISSSVEPPAPCLARSSK